MSGGLRSLRFWTVSIYRHRLHIVASKSAIQITSRHNHRRQPITIAGQSRTAKLTINTCTAPSAPWPARLVAHREQAATPCWRLLLLWTQLAIHAGVPF